MKNNLKEIRKIKKVTQKELSDFLGVSKAMISMWENNPNENIPPKRINQLCKFLNIEESILFRTDLDTDQLKTNTEKEEFEKMLEKFTERAEMENLQLVKLNQSLADLLESISTNPDKLDIVKRFSEILNNEEIDKLFEKNIHPFGLELLLNRILILLEEKNPNILKGLFIILEYFVMLNSEGKLDKENMQFSKFENFIQILDENFQ